MIELIENQWKKFFDDLSGELAHWQLSVSTAKGGFDRQPSIGKSFLVGIAADTGADGQIVIEMMGGEPYNHEIHTICDPHKVSYLQSEKPSGRWITIEDKAGGFTFINLCKPSPLEFFAARGEQYKFHNGKIKSFI